MKIKSKTLYLILLILSFTLSAAEISSDGFESVDKTGFDGTRTGVTPDTDEVQNTVEATGGYPWHFDWNSDSYQSYKNTRSCNHDEELITNAGGTLQSGVDLGGKHEVIEKRTSSSKTFANPDGSFTFVAGIAPVHYQDEQGRWQDIKEIFEDSDLSGFAHRAYHMNQRMDVSNEGKRRWYPRRNYLDEWVEFGEPEYWAGSQWKKISLAMPIRKDNRLVWDEEHFTFQISATSREFELIIRLKDSEAPTKIRWPISLQNLRWEDSRKASDSDGLTWSIKSGEEIVGSAMKPRIMEAGGKILEEPRSTSPSYRNGYLEITVDVSGLQFPIDIYNDQQTFQPNESAAKDTYIDKFDPNSNMGNDDILYVNHYDFSDRNHRALLEFDLTSIPAGATCDDATLTLTTAWSSGGDFDEYVHSLASGRDSWVESEATWNNYKSGTAWTTAGADSADNDYESSLIGQARWPINSADTPVDFSLTASRVEGWFGSSNTNYGIRIRRTDTGSGTHQWHSSSAATASYRPKLVVNYTPPPKQVYYSVGTSTADLKNAANVTVSSGTATFTAGQPDNVGVGDVITYDTDKEVYISGRTSSTVYSVITEKGATPADGSGAVVSIKRVFNSLSDAEDQSDDLSYLNTSDLTAGYQLNWVCYADGPDTKDVIIDGWTTGADNYIKVYTPVSSSEVGTSQRHNGTWDTGKYRLEGSIEWYSMLEINEEFVRVEGLQIQNTDISTTDKPKGIDIDPGSGGEIHISDNIIRFPATSNSAQQGINIDLNTTATAKVWNNIIYDAYEGIVAEPWDQAWGTYYIYNNTVVDPKNKGITCAFEGGSGGELRLKNNLVQGSNTNYDLYGPGDLDVYEHSNNLSEDNTSPDNTYDSKVVTFVNESGNNFHLDPTDTEAINNGADLSSDLYLAFSDDIDGEDRESGNWDIGADEYPPPEPPTTPTLIRIFDNAIFNAYPSYKCTLSVVSTDTEDDIEYEIQWDTDPDFGGASSNTIGPYASGVTVTTTILLGGTPAEAETLFYWKARARDPLGSNTWSSWSGVRSFTMDMELENEYPYWYQTTDEQFDTDTKNGVETYGSDQVRLAQSGTVTFAAITKDYSSSARSSASFSHTTPAGNNRLLIVTTGLEGDNSVSTASYGGNSLTKAIRVGSGASGGCSMDIWYLVNPPTGSNTVSVTFAMSEDPSYVCAMSYNGVNQSSPIGATAGNYSNTGTDVTVNITTTTADALIVGGAEGHGGDTAPYAPGSEVTERYDFDTGGTSYNDAGCWGGEKAAATATEYTFNATQNASDDWAIAAVEVKPAATTEGTLTSPAVVFADLFTESSDNRNDWDGVKWVKSIAADSIGVQIEYKEGGIWSLVPDDSIGPPQGGCVNSTGFFDKDKAFCTVDLELLKPNIYDTLRIKAIFRVPPGKASSEPVLKMLALGNTSSNVTGVSPIDKPMIFALYRNQPNPFINRTEIRYQIPKRVKVELQVFDVIGRSVVTLVNKVQKPGYYSIQWKGMNKNKKLLPSGVYFLRMEAGDFKATQKMVRLR